MNSTRPSMESPTAATPLSRRSEVHLRNKPISCLPQSLEDSGGNHDCPTLTPPPPLKNKSPISPSPLHLSLQTSNQIPLQELLLLSQSPVRRSKCRTGVQGDNTDQAATPCRKSKNRAVLANVGLMGCASPKNIRRARRRLEKENNREERELGHYEEDVGKVRKRRSSRPAVPRREKLCLISSVPSSSTTPKVNDHGNQDCLTGVWELISELIMWKDVAKSSLWFGLGSLFFLSSCFSKDFGFSIISALSHLGLFMLALAFFYDSFSQRHEEKQKQDFKFKEEDILRAIRVLLPTANAAIGTAQDVFSGEPSMTLKVAPLLLIAAKYGHLVSLWRLSATGYFVSFTAPKLYSCYSLQIQRQVENIKRCILESWKACRHKRFVVVSAAMMFWNLFSVKTRIFAAFIAVVVLRYYHQQHSGKEEHVEEMEGVQQQALVVAEKE